MSTVEMTPAKESAPTLLRSVAKPKDSIRSLTLLVVLVGVVWRLTRYLLCFPVWGDESMLLVNYLDRTYLDLAGPLENCQVAPLLFHWAELTAIRLLGTSEYAVRLPPLLACLGSVLLFGRLARLTLSPLARRFAVAILAVSIWPATLGSLVKPYTFDLFFSLALLLCAVTFHRTARLLPLLALTLLVPVAILASYPAVLVAGAVSVALMPVVWRQGRLSTWAIFIIYNLLLLTIFAGHYLVIGKAQLASAVKDSTTAAEMQAYWQHGFPPTEPFALVNWLVLAHTGQMAAYPIGAAAGGSVVTFLLCLVGGKRLWHRRRWLLGLFAGVVALGIIASALRGYPYGASCRLAQHLAPIFCLLAGAGLSALLGNRPRACVAVFVVLAMIGIGGIVRDVIKPYRDDESRQAAHILALLERHAGNGPIVIRVPPDDLSPVLRWQLLRRGDRVRWE
jgi:hypothetical protein